MRRSIIVLGAAILLTAAACSDSSTESDTEASDETESAEDETVDATLPEFDETAEFVMPIDNPYWPMTPGTTWVYEGTDEDEVERIEVTVTGDTRELMGIPASVLRDTVEIEGELAEDTFDWYVQDADGNVWYVGEDSKEYEDGEVSSTAGSWEAGVDGAKPGIIMYADPASQIGRPYYQEFYEGEAEDQAEVIRTGESVTVAAGTFEDVIVIREWNPLEPGVVELKYYAPGVGVILEEVVEGGEGRVELISFTPPAG